MFRQAAALLLLSSVTATAIADDSSLPALPEPTPVAEPSPTPLQDNSATGTYSQSHTIPGDATHEYKSTYEYHSVSPGPTGRFSPSYPPTYSTNRRPVYSSDPLVDEMPAGYGASFGAPVAASGCACHGGTTVYSGSSLGIPAGEPGLVGGVGLGFVGYQAMGYHGGGMETYTGAVGNGMHVRHPYYSYRRPWYANGPMSHNVSIAW